ncbi:uncharacterized protein LOC103718563 isoform X1 [Phoenix dactylifera]|uniref:Uncharacterized protein LOC103718563 isoform X1 n=1 Tax=Phoenix dactylifera TaxID=42345 RepID=A0A8B8ZZ38_PHODC|nr:uncharacterized protein LOC103718563 isoform X1 [Phoenix dactylifera]
MSRVFGGCRALMGAARAGTKAAAAPSAGTSAAKPRNTTGILKPLPVSPAMRKFVGAPEISRAEAVKKIWDHIKLNQLQHATFGVVRFRRDFEVGAAPCMDPAWHLRLKTWPVGMDSREPN